MLAIVVAEASRQHRLMELEETRRSTYPVTSLDFAMKSDREDDRPRNNKTIETQTTYVEFISPFNDESTSNSKIQSLDDRYIHDHGDGTVCDCITQSARKAVFEGGQIDQNALRSLCNANPLFLDWFLRKLDLVRPIAKCGLHPHGELRPILRNKRLLYYRCRRRLKRHLIVKDQSLMEGKILDGQCCTFNQSSLAGSPFYRAHAPLKKIIAMAWGWINGMDTPAAMKFCNIGVDAVGKWYQSFKDAAADIVTSQQEEVWGANVEQIGGSGCVVQIDEGRFDLQRSTRVDKHKGVWTLGIISEEDGGRMIFVQTSSRDANVVLPLIQRYVAPGTVIKMDERGPYTELPLYGYIHAILSNDPSSSDVRKGSWLDVRSALTYSVKVVNKTYASMMYEFAYFQMLKHHFREEDPFLVFLMQWGETIRSAGYPFV